MMELNQRLSNAELDELDDFLSGEAIEDTSMDLSTLEGFLTAIAIGPGTVLPSQWLRWVWDMKEGRAQAEFESEVQANRIMSLVMRYYNDVVRSFMSDSGSFEPIFWRDAQWGAAEWSEGFLLGFRFSEEAWSLLAAGEPAWFTPFFRLGTSDGIDITQSEGDAEKWMNEIAPSLAKIHGYWKAMRGDLPPGRINDDFHLGGHREPRQIVRGSPKIGRNDPCPCGSGKKLKKCCGANGASSMMH
jgi:uncharacterized protein